MARFIECDICKQRFDIDTTMSEVTLISGELLMEHCRLPETRLELCDNCYAEFKRYVDSLVEPSCTGTLEVR